MKILIVEDEEVLARVLEEKFTDEKFNAQTVADGKKVLAAVKSFRPDIVLLDLLLPGKNGLEILAEMKETKLLETLPVIVLSNLDDDVSIKKALSLGAADYFVKAQHPIGEVVEKVKEQLGRPKA